MSPGTDAFDAWDVPPGVALGGERVLDEGTPGALRFPRVGAGDAQALVERLVEGRREGLSRVPAARRARILGRVGRRFLDPADPLAAEALARLPASAGYSAPMAQEVLRGMALDWTPERLTRLLHVEFSDPAVLDGFRSAPGGRRVRAAGPPFTLHLGAGTVPGVSATSLLRALLVGSAVVVKPGRGDIVLPVLLARGLREEAPDLAAAAAVLYWPGGGGAEPGGAGGAPGAGDAETLLLEAADLVVLYGGDETVRRVRSRLPPTTPLVAYRHRVSLGLIGREALSGRTRAETAKAAARAVAVFDQRGCVSPHVYYVEEGGESGPATFAGALAGALDALDRELPPGPLDVRDAAALQQLRTTAELREAAGQGVRVWSGARSSWTVILDPDPTFGVACAGRVVRVVPVDALESVPGRLRSFRRHLQTVALAGAGARTAELADTLATLGVVRIAGLDAVAWPPPWWHHDGLGPLTALVRWTDLEVADGEDVRPRLDPGVE